MISQAHARFFGRPVALAISVFAGLAALTAGCSAFSDTPEFLPVSLPLLLSADGRTVTGFGEVFCGDHPVLVARPSLRSVALQWRNPDTSCGGEATGVVPAHTVLRTPLGSRRLVQVTDDAAIPYFSERNLAVPMNVPPGFRLISDLPTADVGWIEAAEVGDIRTYATPDARLSFTQIIAGKGPVPLTQWPWPCCVRVRDQAAAMLTDRSHGVTDARAVTWIGHGYRFIVTIAAVGQHRVPLSAAQLLAIADRLVLKPDQYRTQ